MGAGRQFIAAEEQLFSARHASYWESLDAGINCFMLAIEVEMKGGDGGNVLVYNTMMTLHLIIHAQAHIKQKNDVMAAMYCLEIAHRLKVYKVYHLWLSCCIYLLVYIVAFQEV